MITKEIKNEYNNTEKYIIEVKEKRNTLYTNLKYYDDILKYTELIKTIDFHKFTEDSLEFYSNKYGLHLVLIVG